MRLLNQNVNYKFIMLLITYISNYKRNSAEILVNVFKKILKKKTRKKTRRTRVSSFYS